MAHPSSGSQFFGIRCLQDFESSGSGFFRISILRDPVSSGSQFFGIRFLQDLNSSGSGFFEVFGIQFLQDPVSSGFQDFRIRFLRDLAPTPSSGKTSFTSMFLNILRGRLWWLNTSSGTVLLCILTNTSVPQPFCHQTPKPQGEGT